MLNINPETVCFIISKARQFQAKEEVVITEVPYSSADDWALQKKTQGTQKPTLCKKLRR